MFDTMNLPVTLNGAYNVGLNDDALNQSDLPSQYKCKHSCKHPTWNNKEKYNL